MKTAAASFILGLLVSASALADVQATPTPPPFVGTGKIPNSPAIPQKPKTVSAEDGPVYTAPPVTVIGHSRPTPVDYVELNKFLSRNCFGTKPKPTPTGAEKDLAGAYDVYEKASFGLALLQLLGIIAHK